MTISYVTVGVLMILAGVLCAGVGVYAIVLNHRAVVADREREQKARAYFGASPMLDSRHGPVR